MDILSVEGKKAGTVTASKKWQEIKSAPQAVKDSVVYYLSAQRQGTVSTKTRSEVNFSTKKPWRQKGTGRARIGSVGSPLWRKGGISLGPKPRDFSIKLPKKVRRLALQNALADKVNNKQVTVVDEMSIAKPKTATLKLWLKNLTGGRKPLVVLKEFDKNINLSVRNIPGANFCRVADLNTYLVLSQGKIIISQDAWQQLEKTIF